MRDRGNEPVDAGVGVRPPLKLFEPKFNELGCIAVILLLVATLNFYDEGYGSAPDATFSSDRNELSKIWCAALASSPIFAISSCVYCFSDPLSKKRLTNLIFLLEIVQHFFCNISVVALQPGADMSSTSEMVKYNISIVFAGLSVGAILCSNIIKTSFFGILDEEKICQSDITLGHNIGTFGCGGYILNLLMHSGDRYSKWKLLILAAIIQVYARIGILNDDNGNTNGARDVSASNEGLPVALPITGSDTNNVVAQQVVTIPVVSLLDWSSPITDPLTQQEGPLPNQPLMSSSRRA